jgi:rod shape-determining protein MreD
MVVFIFIVLGLLLIVLQTTVFMIHPLWVAAPDLYYILVAYLAYRFDLLRSLIIIFPLSWTMDVLAGVVLGMYPALCFGAFFLLKALAVKVPLRESFYQVPMIGVSYLVVSKIVYIGISLFEPGVIAPWSWPEMLVRAGLMVLLAYPLFRFFEFINKRLQRNFISYRLLRVRSGNRYRQEDKQQ